MKRAIDTIVIHCSASTNGVFISPERIDQWHGEPRPGAPDGFNRDPAAVAKFNSKLTHIGYHYVIGTDGRTYPGRSVDEIGAHVGGHNARSIGICMVGTDKFFAAQFQALADLLCTLAQAWQFELLAKPQQVSYSVKPALALGLFYRMKIKIVGHRDLSPDKNGDGKITSVDWLKTCPGFSVEELLKGEMVPKPEWLLDNDPRVASANPLLRVAA